MLFLPHNPCQKVRFREDGAIYFILPTITSGVGHQPRFSDLTVEQDPWGTSAR